MWVIVSEYYGGLTHDFKRLQFSLYSNIPRGSVFHGDAVFIKKIVCVDFLKPTGI